MAERTTKRATSGRAGTKKATKKVVAKKSAKKTTKKAAKKAPVKKSSTKKAITKSPKKTAKKAAKKSIKKSPAKRTTKSKKAKDSLIGLDTKHTMGITDKGVTIFSRVKTDGGVLLVARFFGIGFVFLGVMFSLLGLNRSTEIFALSSIIDRVDEMLVAQGAGGLDGGGYEDPFWYQNQGPQYVDPPVYYSIPSGPVSGEVPMVFNTEVTALRVSLQHRNINNYIIDLGNAQTSDNRTWRINWDSANALDGSYDIVLYKIMGSNPGTTFVESGEQRIRVENVQEEPEEIEEEVIETTSTSNQSAPSGGGQQTTPEDEDTPAEETEEEYVPVGTFIDGPIDQDTNDDTDLNNLLSIQNNTANQDDEIDSDSGISAFADLNYELISDFPGVVSEDTQIELSIDDVVELQPILFKSGIRQRVLPSNQTDINTWRYRIDYETLTVGSYSVVLQVKHSSGSVFGGGREEFKVLQTTDDTDTSTTTAFTIDEDPAVPTQPSSPETNVVDNDISSPSTILVDTTRPLSGEKSIIIVAPDVDGTEVYLQHTGSLRKDFLGRANFGGDRWKFVWDTIKTPNGEYELIVDHRNEYGTYEGGRVTVTVRNERDIPDDEVAYVEDVREKTEREITEANIDSTVVNTIARQVKLPPKRELQVREAEATSTDIVTQKVDTAFAKIDEELREKIRAYSAAIRSGDLTAETNALAELEAVRELAIQSLPESEDLNELLEKVEEEINNRVARVTRDIEKAEEVIKNRVGDAARKDTDNDGITDFDEISIYNTDPFSADSDNDGFTDEAEILGGYDPNDAAQEATIKFESPKDTAIVREDVFVVESIVAVEPPADDSELEEVETDIETQIVLFYIVLCL